MSVAKSFLETVKAGVEDVRQMGQAVLFLDRPGMQQAVGQIGAELGRMATLGNAEMAAALFSGNAYVQYGAGQQPVQGQDMSWLQQGGPGQQPGPEQGVGQPAWLQDAPQQGPGQGQGMEQPQQQQQMQQQREMGGRSM